MPGPEGRRGGSEGSRSREKRRSNSDSSHSTVHVAAQDVTVPRPAAVPPASTSSGRLPISGHATKGTTTTVERSTAHPSHDMASGLSAGSSTSTARKTKDEGNEYQPSKQEEGKLKDKGKRRADDESFDKDPYEHEERRTEELDDTKLGNPNLREATELAALPPFSPSSSPSTSGAGCRLSQRRIRGREDEPGGAGGDGLSQARSGGTGSGSSSVRSNLSGPLWWQAVQRWWKRHVSVTVEAKGIRDHLALERTFLGYLRTSIALSMTGVILAQLFRLQHSLHPDARMGFYVLGIPLASTFIACAIAVALLGAFRFWRQQSAMVRGKVLAGGWEVLVIMVGSLLLTTGVFILLVLVDVRRERNPTWKT